MTRVRLRVLLNAALLLLAAGIAVFLWLDPLEQPAPGEEKLSAIEPARITRVQIRGRGRPPIELRRENAVWRLIGSPSLPANKDRVAALLGLALAPVHDAFRAEGNDLKQFGLEPPKAVVLLDAHEFHFGDTEPLNGRRYVLYGPDVHLITDVYFHHLLATPAAFVDPAPIGDGAKPVGFVLPGATLQLEAGRWSGEHAGDLSADDAGKRLAAAWASARAASVKQFDPELGWERAIEIALDGETQPLRFRLARLNHELVIGREDWKVQYHFPKKNGLRLVDVDD